MSPEVLPDRHLTFRIYAPQAQAVRLGAGDIPGVGQTTAADQGRERRLGGDDRPDRSGCLSLQLQRRRRRDHRSAQPLDQRVQQQRLEPRRTSPARTSWTRRTCRTAPWPSITYNSTALNDVPPDARLHAAGIRDRAAPSIRSSTCCTAPATATTRGPPSGRAGFILDNLIAAGKAKPMIVVMPAGHTVARHRRRAAWSARNATRGVRQGLHDGRDAVRREALPRADRPAHTAIAGLSMGGTRRCTSPSRISRSSPTSACSAPG